MEEAEEEKRTYRVKDGKVWASLKAGETVELMPSEAAVYPEELEEVSESKAKPKKAPSEPTP
jgi:hypothetical protein